MDFALHLRNIPDLFDLFLCFCLISVMLPNVKQEGTPLLRLRKEAAARW